MLKGAFTALVTPFREGVVDEKALVHLIERQIAGGGSNSTSETIGLTRHAESAGAQAALLISPYYNKPSQAGLFAHFRSVSEAVGIPLVLYNVPGRTGVNMLPETVARLSELKNIIGIKEASGDLNQVSRVIELSIDDFYVISGDDFTTLPTLCLGGCGVISVTSNVVPDDVSSMVNGFLAGETEKAKALHYKLSPPHGALKREQRQALPYIKTLRFVRKRELRC